MTDSLRPHGLYPARVLCPWDSLGKNTGVGCHAPLQGILPTETEPRSPALQADSLPFEQGSPFKFGNGICVLNIYHISHQEDLVKLE